MDTSKEYVKMCEKAVEVQEQYCDVRKGDWWFCLNGVTVCISISYYPKRENQVLLPRQDQLQDIWDDGTYGCDLSEWILDAFYSWFKKYGFNNYSMEQLWLSFVMAERFNKVWKEGDWQWK